jgi:excinuclease ABC subunit C
MKNLNLDIDIIGVSKDSRHRAKLVHLVSGEEIDILKVPYKEILGKISEEVHRFAIKFHREKRDKLL